MQEGFWADGEIAIGELSRQTRCNVETIRYYERVRLLPKARRELGGRFRRYDSDDVARLRFIRRARQLRWTRFVDYFDWRSPMATIGLTLKDGRKSFCLRKSKTTIKAIPKPDWRL